MNYVWNINSTELWEGGCDYSICQMRDTLYHVNAFCYYYYEFAKKILLEMTQSTHFSKAVDQWSNMTNEWRLKWANLPVKEYWRSYKIIPYLVVW